MEGPSHVKQQKYEYKGRLPSATSRCIYNLYVDPCANADIRNNMFTADKNFIQARIAD
jgi:hypothetical protein